MIIKIQLAVGITTTLVIGIFVGVFIARLSPGTSAASASSSAPAAMPIDKGEAIELITKQLTNFVWSGTPHGADCKELRRRFGLIILTKDEWVKRHEVSGDSEDSERNIGPPTHYSFVKVEDVSISTMKNVHVDGNDTTFEVSGILSGTYNKLFIKKKSFLENEYRYRSLTGLETVKNYQFCAVIIRNDSGALRFEELKDPAPLPSLTGNKSADEPKNLSESEVGSALEFEFTDYVRSGTLEPEDGDTTEMHKTFGLTTDLKHLKIGFAESRIPAFTHYKFKDIAIKVSSMISSRNWDGRVIYKVTGTLSGRLSRYFYFSSYGSEYPIEEVYLQEQGSDLQTVANYNFHAYYITKNGVGTFAGLVDKFKER